MECRDAQFYLRLRCHAADELGADVTGALDRHLAGCETCAADSRAAVSFDRAMATAMKAVPVPAGLREKLFAQLATKQGTITRRKIYRGLAACAAALVLCGIALGVFSFTRPKVDTEALVLAAEQQKRAPADAVERFLAAQKLPDKLPLPFDYDLLVHYGVEELHGEKVPVIVFRSPHDNGFAKVYIFRSNGGFDLKGIQDAQGSSARAQVRIDQQRSGDVTYVFVHTGRDLAPFLVTRGAGNANPA